MICTIQASKGLSYAPTRLTQVDQTNVVKLICHALVTSKAHLCIKTESLMHMGSFGLSCENLHIASYHDCVCIIYLRITGGIQTSYVLKIATDH